MTVERVGSDWRLHGVRVVHAGELDPNTPQTPGMSRAAAITAARAGAEKLWAGTVSINPAARTGAHHHGALESVIYVVSGRARMRWGERLEFMAEAGPGDFIYVPRSYRTRRSTPARTPPCHAWSYAAARTRSSSTWTCLPSSPIPNRSTGSMTSTASPEPVLAGGRARAGGHPVYRAIDSAPAPATAGSGRRRTIELQSPARPTSSSAIPPAKT